MKLSISLGPWHGAEPLPIETIKRADELGYHAVWTAETYGADCMTQLAFIAAHTKQIKLGTAIAQLDARTPANLAMCAQSIDALAGGGRMLLGLGASGPQIVEGWYGKPWGKPHRRYRDTVAILRKIFQREHVSHDGYEIKLPYQGEGSSGLGKPLKNIMHPDPNLPILLGTATPLNIKLAGEIADGWLGFRLTPGNIAYYKGLLAEGMAKRTDGMTFDKFEIEGSIGVSVNSDVKAALQEPKAWIALYAGGMGASGKNYHNDAMARSFPEAAQRVQELFLAGRRDEAIAAVPDEYVEETWLVGSPERIKERFKPWRDSGITIMNLRITTPDILEMMAKIAS